MNLISRMLWRTTLGTALVLVLGISARAETILVENEDGGVSVVIDGQESVIPADIVVEILDALAEHAENPQGLREALQDIVSRNPGTVNDTVLAVFAVSRSNGSPEAVEAIIGGVVDGNPALAPEALLGALPVDSIGTDQDIARPATRTGRTVTREPYRDTVEVSTQVSPAG